MNHKTTESEFDGNCNTYQQQQRHEENDHVTTTTATTMTPIINTNEGNNNNNNNNSYYASIYNHNNDGQTSSPPTTTIGTGTGITTTTTTILPTTISTYTSTSTSNTNTDLQFVVWNDALHTTCIQNNTLFVTPTQVVQTMYPNHIQDIPTIVHDDDTNTEEENDTDDKININRHYMQWNTLATSDTSSTTSTMNYIDNSIEITTSSNHSQQTQKQKQKHQYEVVKKIIHQRLSQEYNANMAIPISETKKTTPDNNNNSTNDSSLSSSSSNIVTNVLYQSIVPFKFMYSSMKYIANTAVSATTSSSNSSNTLLLSSDDYCLPSNYKSTTTCNDDDNQNSNHINASILQTILSPHNVLSKSIHSNSNDYDITPLKQQQHKKIKSPSAISTTSSTVTTKWDQVYLSIDIMMDCILYIQQQLQIRQQQNVIKQQIIDESNGNNNDDTTTSTIISTIVPVHMIRQEWFQQQQSHEQQQQQQQQKQNSRIAKLVSETLSDQQFHFLLSILVHPSSIDSSNTANNNNHNGSIHESIYLLQRIDREIHLGGSVYILQLPISINNSTTSTIDNVNDDVRLTLYDIHQSMKIIQKNIIQWQNSIEKNAHPIVSSRHINITNKQKVQKIHRQRMYEQHIDNAEATLLNLESVKMSILHTIHVSNPTISILQQAKDVIKTLRPSSLTTTTIESLQQDFSNNIDDDELQNDLDNITLLDFETISHDASNNNDSASDTNCTIPNDPKSNSNNISKKEKTTSNTVTSDGDISNAIVNLELRLQKLTMDIDQTKNLQSSSSKMKQQQNKNMIISS